MKIRNMVLAALFAALMAICAWISLPIGTFRFTLQTFGLCLALLTIGGKWASISVAVYLLLGAIGLPVFSGFHGGLGTLLGPTGGCLFGFMLTCLFYWLALSILGNKPLVRIGALIVGLVICYLCGWLWYCRFAHIDLLAWTAPYLLPDGIKLALAIFLARRLRPMLHM